MSGRPYDYVILPLQAEKIAEVASQTGAAVGLSQSGSAITIHTGREKITINARGEPITNSNQESFPC